MTLKNRKMQRFILNLAIYGCITFMVITVISLFIDFSLRRSDIYKTNIAIQSPKLSKNLILGSSRALTGINTPLFSELTKRKWYNLAMDDTPIDLHVLMYKVLVEQNQIPDILLLQYDAGAQNRVSEIHDKDYQFMIFATIKKGSIYEYMKSKKWGIAYYMIPFLKYTTFNTELVFGFIRLIYQPSYSHRFDKNGDYSYPEGFNFKSDCNQSTINTVSFKNQLYLELQRLCKENGTKLITFTAPYRCSTSKTDTLVDNYLNYSTLFRKDSFFYDNQHLNPFGKDTFTRIIANEFNNLKIQ